ncbi:MAG TPA: hypothetical protein VHD61_05270 [Lacunisphaera sp.]|nr:hypothetical protein [Lacunisphaera sp.]
MKQWLLSAVLVILVAAGLWWQLNTTKISYVNGLEPYVEWPNREFVLERDCYLFAWHKHIDTAHPLLGVNAPDVPTRVTALPEKVDRANIGRTFPLVRIMDVVPKGTRFRILSVRREENRRTGVFISYEITLLDDLVHPFQRVDIRPIQLPVARPGDAPRIDETVAVPWIKR